VDELFLGYNRQFGALNYWNYIKHVPLSLRRFLTENLSNHFAKSLILKSGVLPKQVTKGYDKIGKAIAGLNSKNLDDLYLKLIRVWDLTVPALESHYESYLNNSITGIQVSDIKVSLTGDMLVKMDRASMHNGLEVRAPFLSMELLDYANSLPTEFKMKGS